MSFDLTATGALPKCRGRVKSCFIIFITTFNTMLNLVSPQLENILLKYIKSTYLPDRFKKASGKIAFNIQDINFFSRGASLLSDAFTIERRQLPKNYFNKKENRSAYLLYFTLTNFAKVIKCLDEACRGGAFADSGRKALKILDMGCGPGTASLACSAFFAQRFPAANLTITGVDQNRDIMKDARDLFFRLGNSSHALETYTDIIHPGRIPTCIRGRSYDLILAVNFLNELGGVGQQNMLCQLLLNKVLAPDGAMIILDPALRHTTRALMENRDLLIGANPNLEILGPCLHQDVCPMLAYNRRDWCHFYLEWKCPAVIREVDRRLGIKHEYLKMAYLILRKRERKERRPDDHWRVVSSPLSSKGKIEWVLCSQGRLRRITRLNRDRSQLNQTFDDMKRGDIIRLPASADRVSKDAKILIAEPFNTLAP